MYKLYSSPISPYCLRVIALLEIAGLEYELINLDFETAEYLSPEYLKINPNHQVPTFINDDLKIHESNAILRYLCLKHGLGSLYPENVEDRARLEQLLDWSQCRIAPVMHDIVMNTIFIIEELKPDVLKNSQEVLIELYSILSDNLGENNYLLGSEMTIADIALVTSVNLLDLTGHPPKQKNLVNWRASMNQKKGIKGNLAKLDAA
jgi:glutathione S-transferase